MTFSQETLEKLHNQRKTYIANYDPQWPSRFNQESSILKSILKDLALTIHHIGSTAIPGIKAKPIIDILITVLKIESIDVFNVQMENIGYIVGGEFGLPGRRFFCKGDNENCRFHLHVYEDTHPAVQKYLMFRDYMTNHPQEAKEYEALKSDLAERYSNSRTLYTQNKSNYIETIYQKAAEWIKKK